MNKSIGFSVANHGFGKPELDVKFDPGVYQYHSDSCAFQSQSLVLKEFGINVPQEELMEVAQMQGWYVQGYGTPSDKVGKLLDHYGVDAKFTEDNNIFNLANELAQGHQVIVTVDSGELWNTGILEDLEDFFFKNSGQDHALIVAGIDTSNPKDIRVILTDPGTGHLQVSYSQEQFMDAWRDSNCMMVSTTQSPMEYIAGGNIYYPPMDYFANIPYATINSLSTNSIDIGHEDFDQFFSELISNRTTDFDELLDKYDDIFQGDCDTDDLYELMDDC